MVRTDATDDDWRVLRFIDSAGEAPDRLIVRATGGHSWTATVALLPRGGRLGCVTCGAG